MDAIVGLVVVIAVIWGAGWVIGAVFNTIGAAAKSATGKGSFAENMELQFKGMQQLEVRLKDGHLATSGGEGEQGDASSIVVKEIEGRGLFPLQRSARVGFVTSVFDATSDEWAPVISAIEVFQEPRSVVYQHAVEVGSVSANQGLVSWARVGVVLPDILQTPYSGKRKMVAVLRLVDLDNPPHIEHGYHQKDDSGILWTRTLEFTHDFVEKGYLEAEEHRDEARALSLKIGIAVAMADGSFDKAEGQTLKEWIIRAIEVYSEEKQAELKQLYNQAMRDAYAEAKAGNLSLSSLTERLNEIGESKIKYDAIDLCFDVMAADGVADAQEMKTIRQIAGALELDLSVIEELKDQKVLGLKSSITEQASVEELLGIDPSWDIDRVKKHLRAEFQKWNDRLNTLPEGQERDNAQRMLDAIAEARKKYG